jgi:hypothetical protein
MRDAAGILLLSSIALYIWGKKLSNAIYTGIFVAILLICMLTASLITAGYAGQL